MAEQVSVFLEDTEHLLSILKILKENNIDIRALSISESKKHGILRMVPDDCDAAVKKLKELDYTALKSKVLAIEMPDSPGALYDRLQKFLSGEFIMEYAYSYMEKAGGKVIFVCKFENSEGAEKAARAAGLSLKD